MSKVKNIRTRKPCSNFGTTIWMSSDRGMEEFRSVDAAVHAMRDAVNHGRGFAIKVRIRLPPPDELEPEHVQ